MLFINVKNSLNLTIYFKTFYQYICKFKIYAFLYSEINAKVYFKMKLFPQRRLCYLNYLHMLNKKLIFWINEYQLQKLLISLLIHSLSFHVCCSYSILKLMISYSQLLDQFRISRNNESKICFKKLSKLYNNKKKTIFFL